jgi:hypothetical protein
MTYRLAVPAALAVLLLTPGVGQAAPGRGIAADLKPLAGHSERVLAQGTFQRGVGRFTVAWEVEDFGYLLLLSRRGCGDLPKALDKSTPKLMGIKGVAGGFALQEGRADATWREVRAARSVVLVRRGGKGEREPRACGSSGNAAFLGGVFVGFDGHSERGMIQMTMQRENQILTIAGDGVDQDDVVYAVRLSRRRCAGVEREPGRARYVGPSLPVDAKAFGGRVWDDTDIAHVSRRAARRARSIVLVARSGGGKFEPRACAAAYFAEVVPWL